MNLVKEIRNFFLGTALFAVLLLSTIVVRMNQYETAVIATQQKNIYQIEQPKLVALPKSGTNKSI